MPAVAQASRPRVAGDIPAKTAKAAVSSALAAVSPARKRRAWRKKPPTSALGTRLVASIASSFWRWLCFGLAPSVSGRHWPGAIGVEGQVAASSQPSSFDGGLQV